MHVSKIAIFVDALLRVLSDLFAESAFRERRETREHCADLRVKFCDENAHFMLCHCLDFLLYVADNRHSHMHKGKAKGKSTSYGLKGDGRISEKAAVPWTIWPGLQ